MTPDEVQVIANLIGERMEQVYGEIEVLKGAVREAVEMLQQTAQVLHDNDVAIMGQLSIARGDQVAKFVGGVSDSWERFIKVEAEALGLKIMVPKGEEG